MKVLVTGCAGFIGSNLVDRLLADGYEVVGVDNFNDYYDPKLKRENILEAKKSRRFNLFEQDILDYGSLEQIFKKVKVDTLVHLAARAGVRPSLLNPYLYGQVNVLGTVNLLKLAMDFNVRKFIFGSSSSVYGQSKKLPFVEDDLCQKIVSPYGASKRAAEFFVESFHHSFGLSSVILRFFTVYGERGRPDMAPALFSKAIFERGTIKCFGDGSTSRDYTNVRDIVRGIILAMESNLSFEVINLGNNHPIKLSEFILTLEKITGSKAKVEEGPKHSGDVDVTWANISRANKLLGWKPRVDLVQGLKNYIEWLQKKG